MIIREIHSIAGSPERVVGGEERHGLIDRRLETVGLTDARRGYDMQRPKPTSGHLLVCYEGRGEVWADGEWRPCGTGEAYVAPPRQPMGFRSSGRNAWRFGWVFLAATPDEPPPVTTPQPTITAVDPRPIINAIEGLYLESVGRGRIDRLDLWAELISTYAQDIATGGESADPLWQLWAEVDARLGEVWTLERLSDLAGLRPESLRRLCLKTTGRSPIRQVTHLRMRRAEVLLRSTTSKLFNIARQVGYENTFAFSAAFSRWKKRSPKQCRGSALA